KIVRSLHFEDTRPLVPMTIAHPVRIVSEPVDTEIPIEEQLDAQDVSDVINEFHSELITGEGVRVAKAHLKPNWGVPALVLHKAQAITAQRRWNALPWYQRLWLTVFPKFKKQAQLST